jgi:predicted transglutaminase-like cysteine proteinase
LIGPLDYWLDHPAFTREETGRNRRGLPLLVLPLLAILFFIGLSTRSEALVDGTTPAYWKFCESDPVECSGGGPGIVEFTDTLISLLRLVNDEVNQSIDPENDPPKADAWSLRPEKGDCEDFALTKRHLLVTAGVPASAVRFVLVREGPARLYHIVLAVVTDLGILVLDNVDRSVREISDMRHELVSISNPDPTEPWTIVTADK